MLWLACLLVTGAGLAQPAGFKHVQDISAFKAAYARVANVQSVRSDFSQEKKLTLLADAIRSSGVFRYKRPGRLRLEFTKPLPYLVILRDDRLFVRDGNQANTVDARSNKAFRRFNEVLVQAVEGTLLEGPEYHWEILENVAEYWLEMTPQEESMRKVMRSVAVALDKRDLTVNRIELREANGDMTILKFFNKEVNGPVADTDFDFR